VFVEISARRGGRRLREIRSPLHSETKAINTDRGSFKILKMTDAMILRMLSKDLAAKDDVQGKYVSISTPEGCGAKIEY